MEQWDQIRLMCCLDRVIMKFELIWRPISHQNQLLVLLASPQCQIECKTHSKHRSDIPGSRLQNPKDRVNSLDHCYSRNLYPLHGNTTSKIIQLNQNANGWTKNETWKKHSMGLLHARKQLKWWQRLVLTHQDRPRIQSIQQLPKMFISHKANDSRWVDLIYFI